MTWHYWSPTHYAPWPENPKSLDDMLTRNPATCTFRPPKGEDFETWVHRTAPIIRDALGIPPAPWAFRRRRT